MVCSGVGVGGDSSGPSEFLIPDFSPITGSGSARDKRVAVFFGVVVGIDDVGICSGCVHRWNHNFISQSARDTAHTSTAGETNLFSLAFTLKKGVFAEQSLAHTATTG